MTIKHIKQFNEINQHDVSSAGGKGASLGEMITAGIPVPPGFVILADTYERFIKAGQLNQEIDAILGKVDPAESTTVEAASEKIQSLILTTTIPDEIANAILDAQDRLGASYMAVRSSATAEDSAETAWAGQLDTFLNTTDKNVLENVKKCWASLYTSRSIFYRFKNQLHDKEISVAVVVQKMVESDQAGVAFSVHPVTQDREKMIIEAGFGLGEAVVSGRITPDSYVVDKNGGQIIDVNLGDQEKGIFRGENGGTEWRQLSINENTSKRVLDDSEIIDLSHIVMNIENHYGFPVDVEWARENGKFFIVQSRPITTLSR